ncbi:uncharacterized protein LOC102808559, partial [Saccoglossus kowalevskii]|uniref:Uncharacterized protein LOC102808559 n=1 Tax=Saccoglossus kowalevskii TaxID=10224 RepID=A0ABM0M5S6_SACKO
LSLLQNGKAPQFLEEKITNEIFRDISPASVSPCLVKLREGLDELGIYQLSQEVPDFIHLFQPNQSSILTQRKLILLLKPQFSPEGSNARMLESNVYALFMIYIRETARGKRGNITVSDILRFATGADEEPILGFMMDPSIEFVEVDNSFLPSANTCINSMKLPRSTLTQELPPMDALFNLYDYAFSNSVFGII